MLLSQVGNNNKSPMWLLNKAFPRVKAGHKDPIHIQNYLKLILYSLLNY